MYSVCKFACFAHTVVSMCFFQKVEILQKNILHLLEVTETSKGNRHTAVKGSRNGYMKDKRPRSVVVTTLKS